MHKLEQRPPRPASLNGDRGFDRRVLLQALSPWTNHHCSFCDDFLLGRQAYITHFFPKSSQPEQANSWDNLYIVCSRCNAAQGGPLDTDTLRPDEPGYGFDRYFSIDPERAELRPNPSAPSADQQRARATIDRWQLNRPYLIAARKAEAMKYLEFPDVSLDHYAFRDFLQRLPKRERKLPSYTVTSLVIDHIKCFSYARLEFNRHEPTSLLLGPNSKGKSTVLQLLAIALRGIEYIPSNNAWRNVVRADADVGRFTLELVYEGEAIELRYSIDHEDVICYEGDLGQLGRIRDAVLVLGYGINRHLTQDEPGNSSPAIEPVASLFGDNRYMKNPKLREDHQYLADHFESIQPLVNALFANAGDGPQITLDTYSSEEGYRFSSPADPWSSLPLEALSEGFKSTFVWIIDLLMRLSLHGVDLGQARRAAAIVLLDEIDLHLHPSWQRLILGTLRELFPNIQFIATTHSPLVAQALDLRDIIIMSTSGEGATICSSVYDSHSALSHGAILRELFGVRSRFSVDIEKELSQFRSIKLAILNNEDRGDGEEEEELRALVVRLVEMGPEVEGTVRRELIDLDRRKPGIMDRVWNS
ncbi:MAG: AAA family ATPase [Myxococcota bacterium]